MKRILICDDSEFVRKVIKRELEGRFEIEIFMDGQEAYEYLKNNDTAFDFAIIDGEMPNMDGWTLLDKIKSELKLENLPVVVLTASEGDFFKHKALDEGAFDYLKKPFKSGELLDYLRKFFEGTINKGVVLVVEDSKVQNHTISHQLKLKHIKPISAFSGEEALSILLKGEKVDTILLDINLPGASGVEVAKALKGDSRFKNIPIIGITAASGEEKIGIMKEAFNAGIDDFITKPYVIVELYARIMVNIKRHRLLERLIEENELDYLTKLYNRRTFFRFFKHLAALSKRENTKLSVAMFDIDFFKRVNDTYGHNGGDLVLKGVSKILKNSIRESDILGRIGGEEFCLALPNTDMQGAAMLVDKIRQSIEDSTIDVDDRDAKLTISAGVSMVVSKEDAYEAIKRADEALYKAKEQGRNRVYLFNEDGSVSAYKS